MPIPTHPSNCRTLIYPWNCPSCGEAIYHLRCNHGSSVFLDHNAPPWPIHHCGTGTQSGRPQWLNQVTTITYDDGRQVATGVPGLDTLVRPGSTSSNNPVPLGGRPQGPASRALDPIVAVAPDESDTRQITGTLREIDRNIDHMRAFGYDDDGPMAVAMARAMLGDRWANEFGRITVHTPRPDSAQFESYTAVVPTSLIRNRQVRRGVMVSVKIVSVDVSDRYRYWYCDSFEVLARYHFHPSYV